MIDRIQDRKLMEEMANFTPLKFVSEKAERVYEMCLDQGHASWAKAIRYRYAVEVKSDLVVAFGLALLVTSKNTK